MTSKPETRTTSSSDTTEVEHPGDLTISGAPYRKGQYLYIERGNTYKAVARFLNDDAVEAFKDWVKAVSEAGALVKWEGDGEEGSSQE